MTRRIKKVAVLGSGVMGTGIACHFANIGVPVLMLDIVPRNLSEEQKDNKAARNSIADASLKAALKTKPAPLYKKDFAKRITTGNLEDDLSKISECDWVIEVIIENLDIKKSLFERVDALRKPGTIVSSNTSSIAIHLMAEGRSDDFKKHFLGTHFFNPVRYMPLLEIIPTNDTDQEVTDFLMDYGDRYLGKQTVLCKDTPGFIANRIGVFMTASAYRLTTEMDLPIGAVDKIAGSPIGRPKTGIFRLGDLVGHDTGAKVLQSIKQQATEDKVAQQYEVTPYIQFLLDNKFLGNKTGKGFYEKTKQREANGRPVVLALDLNTLEYGPQPKVDIPSLKTVKQIDHQGSQIRHMFEAKDQAGEFVRAHLGEIFGYTTQMLPEISDNIYSVDQAMRTGYAWDVGVFETWDMIGLEAGIKAAEDRGFEVGDWVKTMHKNGHTHFYKSEKGKRLYYDFMAGSYKVIPGTEEIIILDTYRNAPPVFKNSEVVLHDIGDQVLCLEFTSKANSIGEGVLRGINEAIDIAESGDWAGLVIGNNDKNFSVGANLMMIGMFAFQQEWEELNQAVNMFQQTTMRCRYSSIPVVAATQGYVFGGGCETLMHCDGGAIAAESYIGLVEAGIGLLPGGGGTKEMALRTGDSFFEGDVEIPSLINAFKTVALANVCTSAYEGYDSGVLLKTKDQVVVNKNRNLTEAKQMVLDMADDYTMPILRTDITVLGRTGLAALYAAANELRLGHYASDHDIKIAHGIAYVLCGGDLTGKQQVSEQYLLDIEREQFLKLAGEQKTLERIQHMLQTNRPLRN